MTDMFTLPFMQRALLAGLLVGFLGSYYGVFIVQRRMSFLGDGLAHAAFGGIALGILLDTQPLWIAAPFTVIVSLTITLLHDKTELEADTSIGIFFAVSVALGIIFISLRKDYSVDAFSYLFGSILSVLPSDIWITAAVALATIGTFPKLWGRWAYATFDSELARTDKNPVSRDNYILSVLIAVSIVVSIKLVGIVLIAAFIVIPAATARILSGTFFRMTVISILTGVISAAVGLVASYSFDLPSGATIILVQAFLFVLALILGKR